MLNYCQFLIYSIKINKLVSDSDLDNLNKELEGTR